MRNSAGLQGRQLLVPRQRPSWWQSKEYRDQLIARCHRNVRDRALPYKRSQGRICHVDGTCGPSHGGCEDCRNDYVRALHRWAERELDAPIVGESPVEFWVRVGGPEAEHWPSVAYVLTLAATAVHPAAGTVYCLACDRRLPANRAHDCPNVPTFDAGEVARV